ncbi:ENR1 protein, partial [Dasyornis broadbenti]|nr:ENR1 protein [Dasyornis broadbenti]
KLYQCYAPGKNLYTAIPKVSQFWKSINNRGKQFWRAPWELFWICQDKAYPILPPRWKGSCTLGIIQPGFFLLPEQEAGRLGVPL